MKKRCSIATPAAFLAVHEREGLHSGERVRNFAWYASNHIILDKTATVLELLWVTKELAFAIVNIREPTIESLKDNTGLMAITDRFLKLTKTETLCTTPTEQIAEVIRTH